MLVHCASHVNFIVFDDELHELFVFGVPYPYLVRMRDHPPSSVHNLTKLCMFS